METYIKMKDILKKLPVAESTIYDWLNPKSPRYNPDFPKPIKIGRSTFYSQSEFSRFLKNQSANH